MDNEEQYKIPDWEIPDAKSLIPPADDAWSSMEQLLDKEMPILTDAPKPKGSAWGGSKLWLMGLIAIAVVSVLFILLQPTDTFTKETTDKSSVKKNTNENSAQNNQRVIDETANTTDSINKGTKEASQTGVDSNQQGVTSQPVDTDLAATPNKSEATAEQPGNGNTPADIKTATDSKKTNDLNNAVQDKTVKNKPGTQTALSKASNKNGIASDKLKGKQIADNTQLKKDKSNVIDSKLKDAGNKNVVVKPKGDDPLKEPGEKAIESDSALKQPDTNKNKVTDKQNTDAGILIQDSIQKSQTAKDRVSEQSNDSSQSVKNAMETSGNNLLSDSTAVAAEQKKFTNPFNAVINLDSNAHKQINTDIKPAQTKTRDLSKGRGTKAPPKNSNKSGINTEWLYGLQLNPALPLQNSSFYTRSLDGTNGSIFNHLFPGAFVGIRPMGQNKKHSRSQFMLDINPFFSESIPGSLFLQKADSTRVVIDSSGIIRITRNNTESNFVKINAVNAGISWQYFISSHFTAGISLRGNFVTGALVNNLSNSLRLLNINGFDSIISRTNFDTLYKAGGAERNLLRSAQWWLMPEIVYHTNAWQFGLRGGLPLNAINKSPLATNNYPFQAQLFIRFNLGYKRK